MRILTPNFQTRSLASDLLEEMDQFFNDWNRLATPKAYDDRSFNPACEVSETGDHYLMSIDLPGMKKEDIKIEMTENILTVSGERRRETRDEKHKIQRYEKAYGFFKRSFSLPLAVDIDKVEANYQDGVLELYLPKTEASRPRQVEIQSGKEPFYKRLLSSNKGTIKDVTSSEK